MTTSLQAISGRYYDKAISLMEEDSREAKKQLAGEFPFLKSSLDPDTVWDMSFYFSLCMGEYHWLKRPDVKLNEHDAAVSGASIFFAEHIGGGNPLSETGSPQQYGFLSILFGNFQTICADLEAQGIIPHGGPELYFDSLFQLTEKVLTHKPPKKKIGASGSWKNREKIIAKKYEMAMELYHDKSLIPDESGDIFIPKDQWERFIDSHFSEPPDPKTEREYRKAIEENLGREYDRRIQIKK